MANRKKWQGRNQTSDISYISYISYISTHHRHARANLRHSSTSSTHFTRTARRTTTVWKGLARLQHFGTLLKPTQSAHQVNRTRSHLSSDSIVFALCQDSLHQKPHAFRHHASNSSKLLCTSITELAHSGPACPCEDYLIWSI